MYPMPLIKHVKLPFSCLSQLKYRAKYTYLAAHWCTIQFPQPGAIHFWPWVLGSGLTKSIGNGLAMPTLPSRSALGFALLVEEERCYLLEIHFELLVAIGLLSTHPSCHGLLHFDVPTDPKQYSAAF
jgi:hypothetical protein